MINPGPEQTDLGGGEPVTLRWHLHVFNQPRHQMNQRAGGTFARHDDRSVIVAPFQRRGFEVEPKSTFLFPRAMTRNALVVEHGFDVLDETDPAVGCGRKLVLIRLRQGALFGHDLAAPQPAGAKRQPDQLSTGTKKLHRFGWKQMHLYHKGQTGTIGILPGGRQRREPVFALALRPGKRAGRAPHFQAVGHRHPVCLARKLSNLQIGFDEGC